MVNIFQSKYITTQMDQHCVWLGKVGKNWTKWVKFIQSYSKLVNMGQGGSRCVKMSKNWSKLVQMGPNGSNLSKWVVVNWMIGILLAPRRGDRQTHTHTQTSLLKPPNRSRDQSSENTLTFCIHTFFTHCFSLILFTIWNWRKKCVPC